MGAPPVDWVLLSVDVVYMGLLALAIPIALGTVKITSSRLLLGGGLLVLLLTALTMNGFWWFGVDEMLFDGGTRWMVDLVVAAAEGFSLFGYFLLLVGFGTLKPNPYIIGGE